MTKRGRDLLNDPILNRGTAFSSEERDEFGLRGLLPAGVESLEQQVDRVVRNCAAKSSDLERYIFLMSLQDQPAQSKLIPLFRTESSASVQDGVVK